MYGINLSRPIPEFEVSRSDILYIRLLRHIGHKEGSDRDTVSAEGVAILKEHRISLTERAKGDCSRRLDTLQQQYANNGNRLRDGPRNYLFIV